MDTIEIRKGDTFKARGLYKSNGVPADLTDGGITIQAFVTSNNNFKRQLDVVGASDGTFTVRGDTGDWPLGRLGFFLRYVTSEGDKTSSALMQVNVNDGYN